jgi:hypothetical protein
MKPLPILWQRLVSEGKTCDRCSATYLEMQRAIEKLKQSLHPLGIEPRSKYENWMSSPSRPTLQSRIAFG